jgi:hypothetical protein
LDYVNKRFWFTFLHGVAAVVIGNLIYYLVLTKHLPAPARHQAGHLDLGLLIDFWLCVAIWGVLRLAARQRGWRR